MKAAILVGVLFALVGIFFLVYPDIPGGTKQDTVKIGPIEARTETKDYYHVPPVAGGLVLAGGCALAVWGAMKKKA